MYVMLWVTMQRYHYSGAPVIADLRIRSPSCGLLCSVAGDEPAENRRAVVWRLKTPLQWWPLQEELEPVVQGLLSFSRITSSQK